jgi:membrane protein
MARAIAAPSAADDSRFCWPTNRKELVASARAWWTEVDRTNTLGLASQVAFWLFLSLLPLAAVVGLLVARLAFMHADLRISIMSSVPTAARQLVETEMSHVANWNGGAVGPVAMVMFVWLASGGVHSIFDALELQVGTERAWWKKKLMALGTCVGLSIGAAALVLLASGATAVFRLLGRGAPASLTMDLGPLWVVLRVVLSLIVATAMVYGLFWIGTPPKARHRIPLLPGAVFAVVFGVACGWGYGVYLTTAGIGTGYEAGLAAIGVTMTSIYLLSLGVLLGALLNRHLCPRLTPPARASATRPDRSD